jgi:hypothetical protein
MCTGRLEYSRHRSRIVAVAGRVKGWLLQRSLTWSGTVGVIVPEGFPVFTENILTTILQLSCAIPLASYVVISLWIAS